MQKLGYEYIRLAMKDFCIHYLKHQSGHGYGILNLENVLRRTGNWFFSFFFFFWFTSLIYKMLNFDTPITSISLLLIYRIYSPISQATFAKYFTQFSEFFSEKGGSAHSWEFWITFSSKRHQQSENHHRHFWFSL